MQDIVPKGKSIRNIPLSDARATKAAVKKEEKVIAAREKELEQDIALKKEAGRKLEEDIQVEEEELEDNSVQKDALRKARAEFEESKRRTRKSGSPGKKISYWIGGAIVVVGLAMLVTGVLHGATVTVTPRTATVAINSDFDAVKNPGAGDLGFVNMTDTETGSEAVKATGSQQVSKKATGTIIIYNNYNEAPQRLIKNTRFQTPEGLIFHITDSVTVPGKKGATPGSVEATVIADAPGADYNVGLKDFTIPGFKGDPRYSAFYARSKTPLAGGFVGVQPIVSAADRAKVKADIEAKLRDTLVKQIATKVSVDQVFLSNAYTIDFKELPDEAGSSGQATLKEQGTINTAIFDRKALSNAIAKVYIKDYKGEPVSVLNPEGFTFQPKDFHPGTSDTIAFHVTGNGVIQWAFDANALKQALAGQTRGDTSKVLAKFPQISKADISIRPFWSGTFPSAGRITVK